MSDEEDQGEMAGQSDPSPRSATETPPSETAESETPTTASAPKAGGSAENREPLEQDSIESLLRQAESGIAEAAGEGGNGSEGAAAGAHSAAPAAFELGELEASDPNGPGQSLDLLGDVELDLRIELGRTMMRLEDVLQLRGGSVVVLDKLAGDPVDIFVNGRLVARGEVLVMNDNFCIRVTELAGSLA